MSCEWRERERVSESERGSLDERTEGQEHPTNCKMNESFHQTNLALPLVDAGNYFSISEPISQLGS